MSITKLFLVLAITFAGAAVANVEKSQKPCELPIDPENICMKLESKTYHGILHHKEEKLEVTLHFDKATCAFTDDSHPNRDIFRMQGQINNAVFKNGNEVYRSCVTNFDKQMYNMTLYSDNDEYKIYYLPTLSEQCQVANHENQLCVNVVTTSNNKSFKGELNLISLR